MKKGKIYIIILLMSFESCLITYISNIPENTGGIVSGANIGVLVINKLQKPIIGIKSQVEKLNQAYSKENQVRFLGVYDANTALPKIKQNLIQITIYKEITKSYWHNYISILSLFIIPGYNRSYYIVQSSYFDSNGFEHKIPFDIESTPYKSIWFGWVFLPFFWLSEFNTHFLHRVHYEVQKIISNRNLMQKSEKENGINII